MEVNEQETWFTGLGMNKLCYGNYTLLLRCKWIKLLLSGVYMTTFFKKSGAVNKPQLLTTSQ